MGHYSSTILLPTLRPQIPKLIEFLTVVPYTAGAVWDHCHIKVIDLLVANTSLKERKAYQTMIPNGLNPDGCANAEGLRRDFEFYASMGWSDSKVDPDSLVDSSFCKAAVTKLGPYQP